MIKFKVTGNFNNTDRFLKKMAELDIPATVRNLAQKGVDALAAATPVDSGVTAGSWGYRVRQDGGRTAIEWTNNHMAGGVPVVILLQYGHGTGTGGYVTGRDFINPAITDIFDEIADELWKEVTSA